MGVQKMEAQQKFQDKAIFLVMLVFVFSCLIPLAKARLKVISERKIANVGETAEASIVFKNFIACQKSENELRGCTSEYLDPDLPEYTRKRYEQWLFMKLTITEPQVCSDSQEKFLLAFDEVTKPFLCFEVVHQDKRGEGYVFYRRLKNKRLVITEIKYSTVSLE